MTGLALLRTTGALTEMPRHSPVFRVRWKHVCAFALSLLLWAGAIFVLWGVLMVMP